MLHPGGAKIFAVGPGHAITVVAQGAALSEPNGITWDAAGKRWVVVGFASFASQVYALAGVDARRRIVAVPISVMGKVQFLRLPHAE